MFRKSISLSTPAKDPLTRWLCLRNLELSTADGLPPLPMHVSWAKDGVLIVGEPRCQVPVRKTMLQPNQLNG